MARTMGKGRIARAAIAAALSGTMAFGGLMSVAAPALAETVGVTIVKNDGTPSTKYSSAIKVFTATTIDNTRNEDGGKTEGVAFLSDSARDKILNFLEGDTTATGASMSYMEWLASEGLLATATKDTAVADLTGNDLAAFQSAANVARYVGIEIGKSNKAGVSYTTDVDTPNVPNIVDTNSFAKNFAEAIEADGTNYTSTSIASGAVDLTDTGYYLITGTDVPPMWLPLDASEAGTLELAEKTDQPTVEKKAKDGQAVDFTKIVSAGKGESVEFELIGSLPAKGTDTYYKDVHFTDYLPQGLTLVAGQVTITDSVDGADATDVTSQYRIVDNGADGFEVWYNVDADDTSDGTQMDASHSHEITVTYAVQVNDKATMGSSNLNTNRVDFSYDDGKVTTESESSVATFGIALNKDDENGKKLAGAKFTFQKFDGNAATVDPYVQGDFTKSDTKWEHETDADGKLDLKQLDAGKYLVTETEAPSGYAVLDKPFVIQIDPVYDSVTGEINELKAMIYGEDGTSPASAGVVVATADKANGIVTLKVTDKQEEARLPITGMTPSQLGTIMGLLLVAGGAAMVMRRRQADKTQA